MKYKLPVLYSKADPKQRRLVREQYVEQQGGLCFWCRQPLSGPPSPTVQKFKVNRRLFPPGFFRYPIHLQHCHKTDLTEGAVHAKCNAYMWEVHRR